MEYISKKSDFFKEIRRDIPEWISQRIPAIIFEVTMKKFLIEVSIQNVSVEDFLWNLWCFPMFSKEIIGDNFGRFF